MEPRKLAGFFSLLFCQFALAEFNFQTFQNRNSPQFMLLDSTAAYSNEFPVSSSSSATLQYHKNPIYFDKGEDGVGSLVSSMQSLNLATEYMGWKNFSLGVEASIHRLS